MEYSAFRLGIVGAGMITRNSHLPWALACSGCRVTAIVDPVISRAEELIHSYGIDAKAVSHVEQILDEIDGVIIATPNNTHYELALTCLNRGVSTLIEKPLARTVSEGEGILAAAHRSGAIVAVGYSNRFRDQVILLKELLDGGYFSRVRRFVHQFGGAGGWSPLSGYNLDQQTTGGGVLVVTGTHFLDRMLYLWGFPEQTKLLDDSEGGPEANCAAEFHFEIDGDSFYGLARYSKSADLPAGLVIDTERGIIRLADHPSAKITFRDHSHPQIEQELRRTGEPVFDPEISEFQHQIENFVQAATTRTPAWVTGEQGLASLRLLEELYSNRQCTSADWYKRATLKNVA
jgi:predicted dehydrogenase